MVHVKDARPRRIALVLSGGGARGAYEVGVLWYIFEELSRIRGAPPRIDILSGTSVGAINACYLAAHLSDPVLGLRRLVELWTELEMTRVLGFGLKQIAAIPKILRGGGDTGSGLFDVRPMADLVQKEVSWRAVSRSLRQGDLQALSVSTTELTTGRTVVFMQTSPDVRVPDLSPPRTLFRSDHIGPQHALASAAIPLLFPAVRIDDELYLDGGLRQNTPIAPALRLGATHVLAIGSSREVNGVNSRESTKEKVLRAPGAAFLLGKVLNAFLLDHVDTDLELLNRINKFISDGTRTFGDAFLNELNAKMREQHSLEYSYVQNLAIRPSEDIGRLAAEHVRKGQYKGDPFVTKRLFSVLEIGAGNEADLASYLLFDGPFCRRLIELGRADARARRSDLLAFFGQPSDEPPRSTPDMSGETGSSVIPIGI